MLSFLYIASAFASSMLLQGVGGSPTPAMRRQLSRIDLNADDRDTMMQVTGRRTVPQIFIGDTHVGGCDDLIALDQRGGLMPLLNAS